MICKQSRSGLFWRIFAFHQVCKCSEGCFAVELYLNKANSIGEA
jgi:hypothetical protein